MTISQQLVEQIQKYLNLYESSSSDAESYNVYYSAIYVLMRLGAKVSYNRSSHRITDLKNIPSKVTLESFNINYAKNGMKFVNRFFEDIAFEFKF